MIVDNNANSFLQTLTFKIWLVLIEGKVFAEICKSMWTPKIIFISIQKWSEVGHWANWTKQLIQVFSRASKKFFLSLLFQTILKLEKEDYQVFNFL